jgi:LysR family glycine cleavage system transcriptional activator
MEAVPLNALRAFALAIDRGGVRAAARELDVSHSAVSRHLRELERWLGVALFERGAGRDGFRVTPQGQQLGRSILVALKEIETAAAAVREHRSRNAVTVSCAPSFASRWLLPRLSNLERSYPHLEVSIQVDQRIDDPRESGCDLAIRMGRGPWAGVTALPLMDDALFPVMSSEAWIRAGRPAHPADLLGLRLLHDRDPSASWLLWRQAHGPASLDVRRGPRFGSSDLVLRAAAQGLGAALARERLAAADLEAGSLMRPCGGLSVPLKNAYWVISPYGTPKNDAAAVLTAWLQREAARQLRRP